ncbi:YsnF/AvaK domain-containing protein [Kribbella sp. NPDC056345]|uniref:YsnF/AvaK domain-containing protein n=1 Tax=Kribbella sp. NPDC056345 TaxID=3345789 RepID=UPI0035D84E0A
MTMQGIEQVVGETAYDAAGDKVGSVGTLYTSDTSGRPEWVTVNTGLFGTKHTFVPLDGAHVEKDGLHLATSKSKIKDAPRIDAGGHLSAGEASELYRYYGLQLPQTNAGTAPTGRMTERDGMPGRDGMAEQDGSMVRHEERLHAGTETVETGRVSLHKHVVTEEQQVTVPVSHEEVHVVREPVADGEARPGDLGDEDREVVLHEERPVVGKETVAVERVGLETETVRGEENVTETVRKEQIDVEGLDDKH